MKKGPRPIDLERLARLIGEMYEVYGEEDTAVKLLVAIYETESTRRLSDGRV